MRRRRLQWNFAREILFTTYIKIHDWHTSCTYEIQIGHASDEIREAAELTFTTDVLLPFTVDMTTDNGGI